MKLEQQQIGKILLGIAVGMIIAAEALGVRMVEDGAGKR